MSGQYFKPLILEVSKFGIVVAPREYIYPIDFQVTWSKVKSTDLHFKCILWPFALRIPNMLHLLTLERISYIAIWSQSQGLTTGFLLSIVSSIFYEPFV